MSNKETVIQIRVTASEKQLIQHSAKAADMPMSAWIRVVLLGANLRTIVTETEAKKRRRK